MIKLDFRNRESLEFLNQLEIELKNNKDKMIVCIVNSLESKKAIEKILDKGEHIYKETSLKDEYYIEIIINKQYKCIDRDYVVVIDKDYMGERDRELGTALIKSFITTLSEINKLPSHILLYNEGVKLVSEGSQILEKFISLSDKGVEILCCGSCIKYFDLTDKIMVGRISNMLEILSTQICANKVIKP